jgi:hypothetical protein
MSGRSILVPFLLAAAAATASAQTVSVRGKVEDVSGQPGRFVLDCTKAELTSSAVDLNAFVGQQVALTGAWNGSSDAPVVDVATMQAVAETFEVGGNGQLGGELSFLVTSNPGDTALMFAALDSGFLPASKAGTLLLSVSPLILVASGTVGGDGTFEVKGDVPDDPALDGVTVYGQAFIAFAAGGVALSNNDCNTLHR